VRLPAGLADCQERVVVGVRPDDVTAEAADGAVAVLDDDAEESPGSSEFFGTLVDVPTEDAPFRGH
jgi:hypothetical protein